jgi:hypothetical protein
MSIEQGSVILTVLACAMIAAACWRVKVRRDLTWLEVGIFLMACVLMPGYMLRLALGRKPKR